MYSSSAPEASAALFAKLRGDEALRAETHCLLRLVSARLFASLLSNNYAVPACYVVARDGIISEEKRSQLLLLDTILEQLVNLRQSRQSRTESRIGHPSDWAAPR